MSIDPKILKRMQGDDAWAATQRRGSRVIKLERGQNAILRYLPAKFGPDGLWFARIAKHWVNKQPIVCPRNTAEDFGGDPECDCPVCALADTLNESSDDVISDLGYQSKSNAQYLTYCVMWEKNGVQQQMGEVLNPFEHWHYRNTFDELKGFYIAGGRKSADSVLDYKMGNDFSVNKTAKGLRLDKLDSSPIFDLKDPKFAEYIKKLESLMKQPKVVIPTAQQLEMFAHKLQAAADRGGAVEGAPPRRGSRSSGADEESGFRRGSSRRPAAEEDDLNYDDAPPARPAARRPAPEPEDQGQDQDQEPETTRRRPATAQEQGDENPPVRRAAPRARTPEPEPEPDQEPEAPPARATRRAAPAPEPEPEPEPEQEPETPPVRRAAPRGRAPEPEPEVGEGEGEPEQEPEVDQPPARGPKRGVPPDQRAAGRAEASRSAPQADPEDEDPLPEDDKDPVPAAEDDAPPRVAAKGAEADKIKQRLAKLGKNA